MPGEPAAEVARRLLARGLVLLAKAAARAWPRFLGFCAELRQQFSMHRLRSLLGLAFLAAVLLAGARLLPVAYGRAALAHAAGIAAQQSRMKGEDRALFELRARAYDLGFTEAALETDLFRMDSGLDENGPICTVTYDFVHTVRFFGRVRLPLKIHGKVARVPVDPLPSPWSEDLKAPPG